MLIPSWVAFCYISAPYAIGFSHVVSFKPRFLLLRPNLCGVDSEAITKFESSQYKSRMKLRMRLAAASLESEVQFDVVDNVVRRSFRFSAMAPRLSRAVRVARFTIG